MDSYKKFRNKTIKQIRIWAWIAAVLPVTALAGLSFIWMFGTDELYNQAMIVGQTVMFTVSVIWWWWALYAIRKLLLQWETTRENVAEVLTDLREVRVLVKETFDATVDK